MSRSSAKGYYVGHSSQGPPKIGEGGILCCEYDVALEFSRKVNGNCLWEVEVTDAWWADEGWRGTVTGVGKKIPI